MLIMNIIGGVGNQLFEAALGLSLLYSGVISELCLDATTDQYNISRPCLLEKFNIKSSNNYPITIVTSGKVNVAQFMLKYKTIHHDIYRENANWKLSPDQVMKVVKSILTKRSLITLTGCYQSEEYFNKYSDKIRKSFKVNKPLSTTALKYKKQILSKNSVCMHVRRGDYLHYSFIYPSVFHILNPSYYKKASIYMLSVISKPHFFIFSDDIPWCKKNINKLLPKGVKYTFVEETDTLDDLQLMTFCKHNIIANSTFSWWGAWLNNNKNKIVIAPKKWFKTNTILYNHVIPKSWLKF